MRKAGLIAFGIAVSVFAAALPVQAASMSDLQQKTYEQMREALTDKSFESEAKGELGNLKLDLDKEMRSQSAEIERRKKEMDAKYRAMEESMKTGRQQQQAEPSLLDSQDTQIQEFHRKGTSSGRLETDSNANEIAGGSGAVSGSGGDVPAVQQEGIFRDSFTKGNAVKFIAASIVVFVCMLILFAASKKKNR